MEDQKIGNLLNLALDATSEELEKSEDLNIGYNPETQTWEVIVRFSGEPQALFSAVPAEWETVILSGGYAIVTLSKYQIKRLAAIPQVEYIEAPKRLYFSVSIGRSLSCLSPVQAEPFELYGKGVLVAVIDSGVDYFHPDFRNADGTTRIRAIWDQSAVPSDQRVALDVSSSRPLGHTPAGFTQGLEYTQEDINAALAAGSREAGLALVTEQDFSGHGTEVLGIAAGNGRASGNPYRGIAAKSDILIVKLGTPRPNGFPGTAELMQALEYVTRKAAEFAQPMAVNLSFGNAYGSHRGDSLLETYINTLANQGRNIIIAGTGNEANTGGHVSGQIPTVPAFQESRADLVSSLSEGMGSPGSPSFEDKITPGSPLFEDMGSPGSPLSEDMDSFDSPFFEDKITPGSPLFEDWGDALTPVSGIIRETSIEFLISDYEPTMNLQLWKNYADEYEITIVHPNGRRAGPFHEDSKAVRYHLGMTTLLIYYGEPSPSQAQQEIYIDFIPDGDYIDSGVWQILLTPQRIVTGDYSIWMPDARARNSQTRFLNSSPDTTMTIPSTASGVIAVGAYDARLDASAPFSGRGWPETFPLCRPDLVAPGVDIMTTAVGGGYVSVSGTSFAAPFVTGSAALLMEWGILRGHDPYLYGEKIRACLHRGARHLSGYTQWPNNQVGYGALCLRDSLPA